MTTPRPAQQIKPRQFRRALLRAAHWHRQAREGAVRAGATDAELQLLDEVLRRLQARAMPPIPT